MCELTLEAFGYRDNEARVTRRIHGLLHEQQVGQPLPEWLHRKMPWAGSVCRSSAPWRPIGDPRALPVVDAVTESHA